MDKPIRVLHVFRIMNRGGAETMVMNVYRKIDRTKIQFDFLCTDNKKGAYDDEIRSLGGNIFIIDRPSNKHVIKNIKDIVNVIKNNCGYDAIHIPAMFYSGIVCLSAWIAGISKRVVHSHSSNETQENTFIRNLYKIVSRQLINTFATDKISCGHKAREFLFGKSDKVKKDTVMLYNGIDLDRFSKVPDIEVVKLKDEFKIIKNELIIGNVARFSPVKNHDFFIGLANFIREKKISFKIILVGDGELKKDFGEKIKQNNLEKYFVLTGVRKDIPEILNTIDVLVMPSFYEGFPVSVIESLSSGTPCLLSSTISKETAIIEGMVTFLDIDDKYDIWYEEILKLKSTSNNMDKRNINNILTQKGFSVDTAVEKLSEIYLK